MICNYGFSLIWYPRDRGQVLQGEVEEHLRQLMDLVGNIRNQIMALPRR